MEDKVYRRYSEDASRIIQSIKREYLKKSEPIINRLTYLHSLKPIKGVLKRGGEVEFIYPEDNEEEKSLKEILNYLKSEADYKVGILTGEELTLKDK